MSNLTENLAEAQKPEEKKSVQYHTLAELDPNAGVDPWGHSYNVPQKRLDSLINKKLMLLGYQAHIKTKFGDDKYLMLCSENLEDPYQDLFKVFVGSAYMKTMLNTCRDKDLFPLVVTIVKDGSAYRFM